MACGGVYSFASYGAKSARQLITTEAVSPGILRAIELPSWEKQPGFCCVLFGSPDLLVAGLPPYRAMRYYSRAWLH